MPESTGFRSYLNFEFGLMESIYERTRPRNRTQPPIVREMRLAICEYACHLLDTGHIRGPRPIGEVKCHHYSPSSPERHWIISCDPKILFPSKIMRMTNVIQDLREYGPARPMRSNNMGGDRHTTYFKTVLGLTSPSFSGHDCSRLQADLQHIEEILSDKPPNHRREDYRHGGFTESMRPSGPGLVGGFYLFKHVQLCFNVSVRSEDDARFIRAVDRAANELIEAFRPAFEEAFSRGAPGADLPVLAWSVEDSTILFQRRFRHLLQYIDVRFYFHFSDRLLRYVRGFILAGEQVPDPPEDRSILTLFDLIDAPICRQQYEEYLLSKFFSQLFSPFFLFPLLSLPFPEGFFVPRTGDTRTRAKPECSYFVLQSLEIPFVIARPSHSLNNRSHYIFFYLQSSGRIEKKSPICLFPPVHH